MRISDWSSDVCSSDLIAQGNETTGRAESVRSGTQTIGEVMGAVGQAVGGIEEDTTEIAESAARIDQQCGGFVSTLEAMDGEVASSSTTPGEARADRQRVVEGQSVSVREDLGGRRILK